MRSYLNILGWMFGDSSTFRSSLQMAPSQISAEYHIPTCTLPCGVVAATSAL
jgi:hypothetical protein